MSTTKEQLIKDFEGLNTSTDNETIEVPEIETRRDYNGLDDKYINAYCSDPKAGKKSALIKAGFVGEYAAQEAYRMHKRLSDRIKARYDEMISELDTLAYSNLLSILEESPKEVGYSNALAAIKQGMEYAGRKPGETLTIKTEQPIEEIEQELKLIEEQEQAELH